MGAALRRAIHGVVGRCDTPHGRIKEVRLRLGKMMAIEITHVRFGSTKKTEDKIVRYRWKNVSTGKIGENDKPSLVAWVDDTTSTAYVGSGVNRVNVTSVHPANTQPYLRTHADGKWTNNLVNLSTF